MFLSHLGHIQRYFGLVVRLRLWHLALVWRQALQDSVEVSAFLETCHRTAPVDTTAALLSPDSSCLLKASQFCHDPVKSQLFHYSKLPLISVLVVVLDKAHISILSSTRGGFICYCVTFWQPTKVLFRPVVPDCIFAFSQVFRSLSELWVLFIVYVPLR